MTRRSEHSQPSCSPRDETAHRVDVLARLEVAPRLRVDEPRVELRTVSELRALSER